MNIKHICAVIVLIIICIIISIPFLTRMAVITDLKLAVKTSNEQKIIDRVAWNDLNTFLIDDLQTKASSAQNSTIFANKVKLRPKRVPDIVDYYVRPENIRIPLIYRATLFPDVPISDFVWSVKSSDPMSFKVTAGYPKNYNRPNQNLGDFSKLTESLSVDFVFKLDGLTWKIHEMHVPIMLVPSVTYNLPATEIYIPDEAFKAK